MNPIKFKHRLFSAEIKSSHDKSFLFRFIYKRYNKLNYPVTYDNELNDTLTINLFDLEINITFPWRTNYIEQDTEEGFASTEKCYGFTVKNTYSTDHIFYLTAPNNFFKSLNKIVPDSYLIFSGTKVHNFDSPIQPRIYKTTFYDNSYNEYKSYLDIPSDKLFNPTSYTYIHDNGDIDKMMIKYHVVRVDRRPKYALFQNLFSISIVVLVISFPDGLQTLNNSPARVYSYDLIMKPGELPIEAIRRMEREKRWKEIRAY